MMGYLPVWREAITQALKGDRRLYEAEIVRMLQGGAGIGARLLTMAFLYAASGQPAYCVGPRLQEKFRHTSVRSTPLDNLNTPYPTIYVALPECEQLLWGGLRTQWHHVSGVYVMRNGDALSLLMWAGTNERSVDPADDATFWVSIELGNCPRGNDPGTKDVEYGLKHVFVDEKGEMSDPGMGMPESKAAREEITTNIGDTARIVVNLLQYLNTLNPEIEEQPSLDKKTVEKLRKQARRKGKKGARARQRLANHTEAKVVWVGPSIERAPRYVRATVATGRAVTPHWRKGHFHSYWVGPRKDAEGNPQKGTHRVSRWIEPILIGHRSAMVGARGKIHHLREDHE